MQDIAGIDGQQGFGWAKEGGKKVEWEDRQNYWMRTQETHAIHEGADSCLRSLFNGDTGYDHEQQWADDDKIGNDVDPVGVRNASPGDHEAAEGRAYNKGELHHDHTQRHGVGHLLAWYEGGNDSLAGWKLKGWNAGCDQDNGVNDKYVDQMKNRTER